jgi:hypothetical protein
MCRTIDRKWGLTKEQADAIVEWAKGPVGARAGCGKEGRP